jgi:hypothetical protein
LVEREDLGKVAVERGQFACRELREALDGDVKRLAGGRKRDAPTAVAAPSRSGR